MPAHPPAKTNVCRVLDGLGLTYAIREYDWSPEQLDALGVASKVGLPAAQVFKTLVVRGDRSGVLMACVPADRELDLKALAAASGNRRVALVASSELQRLTGYVRGGVSPIGTRKPHPVFVHATLPGMDAVSVSAGRRGTQIVLKGSDLVAACGALAAPIAR